MMNYNEKHEHLFPRVRLFNAAGNSVSSIDEAEYIIVNTKREAEFAAEWLEESREEVVTFDDFETFDNGGVIMRGFMGRFRYYGNPRIHQKGTIAYEWFRQNVKKGSELHSIYAA